MNKYVNAAFVTLGIVFLALILIAAGAYLALNYTSFGGGTSALSGTEQSNNTNKSTSDGSGASTFTMSEEQRQAIAAFGIDPSTIPTTITAEQEACFVGKLGQARVDEIKDGAVPGTMDFFKVKSCI
jgi:hypothetical protein